MNKKLAYAIVGALLSFGACAAPGQSNFAVLQPVGGQKVLLCDPSNGPQQVNFGHFWQGCSGGMPCDPPLGHFLYQTWLAFHDSGSRYVISDGEGGQHAILAGATQAGSSINYPYMSVQGSPSSGGNVSSVEGLENDEWGEVGYGWDGNYLRTYIDGVETARNAFTGPRASADPYSGNGTDFYVCGSDHSNGHLKLASMRGFEGTAVLNYPELGWAPESRYRDQWYDGAGGFIPTNFMAMFTTPEDVISDLSAAGYNGERHNGTLFNAGTGPDRGQGGATSYPIPGWVTDDGAPTSYGTTAPTAPYPTPGIPPSTPSGALVFDSFTRRNHTWAWDETPTLGSTEAGTAGTLEWTASAIAGVYDASFGVLHERAVFTGQAVRSLAWVTPASAPTRVQVDRFTSNGSGVTGVTFRVANRSNFAYCWTMGLDPAAQTIWCGYYLGGVDTWGMFYDAPASWTTLRVDFSGTSATVYADSTAIATFSLDASLTAKGVGIFQGIAYPSNFIDGLARWDNFTAF